MNPTAQNLTAGGSVTAFIAAMEISKINEYLAFASFIVSITCGLVYLYFKLFKGK